ncbi:MAG: hypothetical protein OEN51_12940, partial [Gammaproteobacteria bacterium]|nr:hypothetical protein [Gammaproteobacteria bacterium]
LLQLFFLGGTNKRYYGPSFEMVDVRNVMRCLKIIIAVSLALTSPVSVAQSGEPSFVAVDENLWVTFYDVPSHRFRAIRDAFVRRNFESSSRDLVTSASYLKIESGRAVPGIAERLEDVAAQMMSISQNIGDKNVTATTLDQLFGRAHWLLAQHYLHFARESRNADNNRMSGRYLWATAHHLERAVLWSNARIDKNVVTTLEELRDLASRLQDSETAPAARKEKPIARAEKLLVKLGAEIDRPVVLNIQ